MAKGYVHRVYQFVPADFTGFDPPRAWTRFDVGEAAPRREDLGRVEIPEGSDGPTHTISNHLYEQWRLTLDSDHARAIDRLATARANMMTKHVDLYERELEAAARRAWSPERTMLIRARP
jgi:hypothetical protein